MLTPEQSRKVSRRVSARRFALISSNRFWFEIVTLTGAVAFALALLIATLGTVGGAAASEPKLSQPQSIQHQSAPASATQTYEGMISDSHCGAKHSAAIGLSATDCTIMCVRGGEHFLLVDDKITYVLEGDPTILKQSAGRRVKITGTENDGTISVTAVSPI
jgi:hypothetical protein